MSSRKSKSTMQITLISLSVLTPVDLLRRQTIVVESPGAACPLTVAAETAALTVPLVHKPDSDLSGKSAYR